MARRKRRVFVSNDPPTSFERRFPGIHIQNDTEETLLEVALVQTRFGDFLEGAGRNLPYRTVQIDDVTEQWHQIARVARNIKNGSSAPVAFEHLRNGMFNRIKSAMQMLALPVRVDLKTDPVRPDAPQRDIALPGAQFRYIEPFEWNGTPVDIANGRLHLGDEGKKPVRLSTSELVVLQAVSTATELPFIDELAQRLWPYEPDTSELHAQARKVLKVLSQKLGTSLVAATKPRSPRRVTPARTIVPRESAGQVRRYAIGTRVTYFDANEHRVLTILQATKSAVGTNRLCMLIWPEEIPNDSRRAELQQIFESIEQKLSHIGVHWFVVAEHDKEEREFVSLVKHQSPTTSWESGRLDFLHRILQLDDQRIDVKRSHIPTLVKLIQRARSEKSVSLDAMAAPHFPGSYVDFEAVQRLLENSGTSWRPVRFLRNKHFPHVRFRRLKTTTLRFPEGRIAADGIDQSIRLKDGPRKSLSLEAYTDFTRGSRTKLTIEIDCLSREVADELRVALTEIGVTSRYRLSPRFRTTRQAWFGLSPAELLREEWARSNAIHLEGADVDLLEHTIARDNKSVKLDNEEFRCFERLERGLLPASEKELAEFVWHANKDKKHEPLTSLMDRLESRLAEIDVSWRVTATRLHGEMWFSRTTAPSRSHPWARGRVDPLQRKADILGKALIFDRLQMPAVERLLENAPRFVSRAFIEGPENNNVTIEELNRLFKAAGSKWHIAPSSLDDVAGFRFREMPTFALKTAEGRVLVNGTDLSIGFVGAIRAKLSSKAFLMLAEASGKNEFYDGFVEPKVLSEIDNAFLSIRATWPHRSQFADVLRTGNVLSEREKRETQLQQMQKKIREFHVPDGFLGDELRAWRNELADAVTASLSAIANGAIPAGGASPIIDPLRALHRIPITRPTCDNSEHVMSVAAGFARQVHRTAAEVTATQATQIFGKRRRRGVAATITTEGQELISLEQELHTLVDDWIARRVDDAYADVVDLVVESTNNDRPIVRYTNNLPLRADYPQVGRHICNAFLHDDAGGAELTDADVAQFEARVHLELPTLGLPAVRENARYPRLLV